MNPVQVHLALNHVPILASIASLLLLGLGLRRKSQDVLRVSLWAGVLAAAVAIPVYLTGEPSEEAVERLPAVSKSVIERHEDAAKLFLTLLGLFGALSAGVLLRHRRRDIPRALAIGMLVVALVVAVQAAWTGHLGGQIRHSELRAGAGASAESPVDGRHD